VSEPPARPKGPRTELEREAARYLEAQEDTWRARVREATRTTARLAAPSGCWHCSLVGGWWCCGPGVKRE
jgi:hypothetical protein